jgi:hypothetical protein
VRSALYIALLAACSYQHGVLAKDAGGDPNRADASDTTADAPDAAPQATVDAMPDAKTCPNDFVALVGGQPSSRYKLYSYGQSASNAVAFNQAMTTCATAGGYVAIPNDENEMEAFDDISQNPNQPGYWVGITDQAQEGVWRTVLGDPATYLPWSTAQGGQPNGGAAADCVVGFDEDLYDVDCAMATYVFICECSL